MENVDFNSSSGPNQFGKKLAQCFLEKEHQIVSATDNPDIQLSFIRSTHKVAPLVQRLDGIHFGSHHDWRTSNESIYSTYRMADAIIFQSLFDQKICNNFFGRHRNATVIYNGTNIETINQISPYNDSFTQKHNKIWCCSSRWTNRPNKRLKDNIEYFLHKSNPQDGMIVLGPDSKNIIKNDRILYLGRLSWEECISIYKKSNFFVHLAFTDHCPNVVVDARASGCHIICSSCAGTPEIAGLNSTIIQDYIWDYKSPLDYKNPPPLDFEKNRPGIHNISCDINDVADKYIDVFKEVGL